MDFSHLLKDIGHNKFGLTHLIWRTNGMEVCLAISHKLTDHSWRFQLNCITFWFKSWTSTEGLKVLGWLSLLFSFYCCHQIFIKVTADGEAANKSSAPGKYHYRYPSWPFAGIEFVTRCHAPVWCPAWVVWLTAVYAFTVSNMKFLVAVPQMLNVCFPCHKLACDVPRRSSFSPTLFSLCVCVCVLYPTWIHTFRAVGDTVEEKHQQRGWPRSGTSNPFVIWCCPSESLSALLEFWCTVLFSNSMQF